ncbi:MAG: hypothetical protein M3209_14670 [Acidobacteriota bacterium]|nr:hypothetical protein [Acidobacteriota bacterium]
MAQSLPLVSTEMTFSEFLIIYLSIGAPFGVYFFLNRRSNNLDSTFLLKVLGVIFGWCFYAVFWIFRGSQSIYGAKPTSDSIGENEIEKHLRELLAAYSEISGNEKKVSFFQFRETIERYVGLTEALRDSAESTEFQNELFVVAGRKNQDLQLANRCLQRKNLLRLKAHQIQARQDFLQIFDNLSHQSAKITSRENLFYSATRLVVLLADDEADNYLNRIKKEIEGQNPSLASSSKKQEELWKPQPLEQIPVLHTQSSTLNLAMKTQD